MLSILYIKYINYLKKFKKSTVFRKKNKRRICNKIYHIVALAKTFLYTDLEANITK
jgi:hypothetical protein